VDELIQLLLFAAIILFGIFGRKKKKPQQAQRPRPRPQQPRPRPRTEMPARPSAISEAGAPGATATRTPAKPRGLAEELFHMLQQQMEAPQRVEPPKPERVPLPEPVVVEEAESLETLEPAGEASHRRFHDLYMDQPPSADLTQEPVDKPYEEPAARRKRLELTRQKLQHAFIMKEIIGPPKGMERMGE
jgi:hypothetical protein